MQSQAGLDGIGAARGHGTTSATHRIFCRVLLYSDRARQTVRMARDMFRTSSSGWTLFQKSQGFWPSQAVPQYLPNKGYVRLTSDVRQWKQKKKNVETSGTVSSPRGQRSTHVQREYLKLEVCRGESLVRSAVGVVLGQRASSNHDFLVR